MVDYRLVMRWLLEGQSYRTISAGIGVAQATISKARKAMESAGISTIAQIEGLSDDEIALLVGDGRVAVTDAFVPIDVEEVIQARTGRDKTALNVLWAEYVRIPAPQGLRHYSYERFRQVVAAEVASRGLTARIAHAPGATMQVDWAGTKMALTDPVSGRCKKVSVFVASLPYSGMIFACASNDERQDNWHQAHRLAFEYFGGVADVIVPDNAATATNAIARGVKVRRINRAYEEFLAHYGTAAFATPPLSPTFKATVEAGVKVVTNHVIGRLARRQFCHLDDLNQAILEQVEAINSRVPFRDQPTSRRDIFTSSEVMFLSALPQTPFVSTTWKKSKVAPDWHITIATVHYSVPYTLIGTTVDVRLRGEDVDVFAGGQRVAHHKLARGRGVFVTDVELHGPPGMDIPGNLWTSDYFLAQASRVGPATRKAIESLLASKPIRAQAYQPARAILAMGKGDNKLILEQACQRLTHTDSPRAVSYTAVKNMMTAIRAEHKQRPTTTVSGIDSAPGSASRPAPTGPRQGLLGGSEQFLLENLSDSASTASANTHAHTQSVPQARNWQEGHLK